MARVQEVPRGFNEPKIKPIIRIPIVFMSNWSFHRPGAFDLAVSSGLRCGVSASSAADGFHVYEAYEQRMRTHLDTDVLGQHQGLQVAPLIGELSCDGCGLCQPNPAKLPVQPLSNFGSASASRSSERTHVPSCATSLSARWRLTPCSKIRETARWSFLCLCPPVPLPCRLHLAAPAVAAVLAFQFMPAGFPAAA